MDEFTEKIKSKLQNASKIVFMGIGEEKLQDDGVGPYIVSELLDYSNERILFLNAATDPMERRDEVVEFAPSHLVIFDTCTYNGPPGTVVIIERENIQDLVPISTHNVPISIIIDLIREELPDLEVFMIGIVPKTIDGFDELTIYKENEIPLEDRGENLDLPFFNFNLTDEIQKVGDSLIEMVKTLLKDL